MPSVFEAIRAGGLAAGIVLAMSFAGGVSFAEPDSGTAPPSDPSAASQDAPPEPNAGSAAGSSSDTSEGPTSKLGNGPTDGIDGSGATQPSSEDLQAQEDALSSGTTKLADLTSQISGTDQQLDHKITELKLQGGDSISTSDMLEMQAMMDHLNQLSEMSSAVVSEANAALAGMGRNVKE